MKTRLALLVVVGLSFGCAHIDKDDLFVFVRGCALTLDGVEVDLDGDGVKQKVDLKFVAHAGVSDTFASLFGWLGSIASNFFGGGADPDQQIAKSRTGCDDIVQALRTGKATLPAESEPFVVKLEPL